MQALKIAIIVAGISSFSLVSLSSADGEYCYDDGLKNSPTIAERISMEFKHFFQTEIRKYDTSSPKDFEEKSNVALWNKAISRLDIPEKDDDGTNNLFKMKRFLSSVMTEISDAAYPDPNNPEDLNHDWIGRAGGGRRWKRKKNRANHDSLNHMRSASISLYFVHLVQRHRPDVWDRILSARGIEPGSDDERLYVMNFFVASYLSYIFRTDEYEGNRGRYNMTDDAKEALMSQFSSLKKNPELKCSTALGMISSAWFLRRLSQTAYYQPLLGKYLDQMVRALISVNIVHGKFTDPNIGNSCAARAFLHDEHGVEYDFAAVSDDKLAAHFEMGVVYVGHFIDHIRLNYSHFTKPLGCASVCIRLMYDKLFGSDKTQIIQETYSFWTYLTQQAGIIVSSAKGDELSDESVFDQMKEPDEIRLEMGKTFYESNPWAGRHWMAIEGIWDRLTRYPPKDEAQNKFQALCKDFNLFFDSFFAERHVRRYLGEGTADFFIGLFR